MQQIENYVTLSTIDEKWMEHLDNMDNLKEGIWLRGDKQTVISEYKKEAFIMFEGLISSVETGISEKFFRVQPKNQPLIVVQPKHAREVKEDIHESLAKEVQDATIPSARPASTQGSMSDLAAALKGAKANKKASPGMKLDKIGRNDLCPCGSGLKYKRCGLIGAQEHRE